MIAHAKLSASGSHRWLACPGSVAAEQGMVDKRSTYADEGSAAHELAETVLTRGGAAHQYEGKPLIEYNEIEVTREMCDAVQMYVDYVRGFDGELLVEERVDFSPWVPDGFGTSDVIIIDGETLRVIDLKYGKGLQVDADNNPQAMLYALGALNEYGMIHDFKTVEIAIVQPRLDHISEWSISVEDLEKWGVWVSDRAALATSDDAERVPGDKQCQWCKAKATCKALEQYTARIIGAEFDDLEAMDNPQHLTPSRIAEVLAGKKLIEGWLSAVAQYATERLESGEAVPGYKLVEGRSVRRWSDEKAATVKLVGLLGDDAYERKLLSVAKAEKALGKKRVGEIAEMVVKPSGKPTLAPESDKRAPINISACDFDDFSG